MTNSPSNIIALFTLTMLLFSSLLPAQSAHGEERTDLSSLYSETAVLMDADTGQILFEKKSNKQMSPASITKIASGITAIERGNLQENVEISEEAANVDGSSVYLVEEEKMPLKQLIQGMLINSGNDAGTAIAEHFNDSEKQFSENMTTYLEKQTGIENTNFTNPHGLYGEDHFTTAEDMALITRYAMENDTFRDIVSTKELEWEGEGWETTLRNHHQLLWDYEGATGVKNGYVSQAGFTLVTSAERDGREFIAVVMKSGSSAEAYDDTKALLDFGFDKFKKEITGEEQHILSSDGTKYIIPEDFSYLKQKDTKTSLEITNDGMLTIVDDETADIIRETGLQREQKLPPEEKRAAEPSEEKNENSEGLSRIAWTEFGYIMADMIRYQMYFWRN